MSDGFYVTDAGRLLIRLDDDERRMLISLAHQLIDFVQPAVSDPHADPLAALVGIDNNAELSEDPALARLLPDAYADDPEAARDFRRFTERSLREAKVANAHTVIETIERSGPKVSLVSGEAQSWLGFLNDSRLAIGTRAGIEEDNHDELAGLPEDDPRLGLFYIYDWLTYLQETLVRSLMPDL